MRTILFFLIPLLTVLSSSANTPINHEKKDIIIAGKIINYDYNSGKNILTIYVNDNGRATQLNYPTKM